MSSVAKLLRVSHIGIGSQGSHMRSCADRGGTRNFVFEAALRVEVYFMVLKKMS